MFIYIIMDAKNNENTPAISVPLLYEDKYMYTCACMYNMHILDKIAFQVSRNVHILIRETSTHIIMDAKHNETTHTLQLYSLMKILMFTAHIYPEKRKKYTSCNRVLEMFIYIKMDAESNETRPAISFLLFHEDYEIFAKNNVRSWSIRSQIVELEKKQGQIWNQRPLKRWRPLWPFLLRF